MEIPVSYFTANNSMDAIILTYKSDNDLFNLLKHQNISII